MQKSFDVDGPIDLDVRLASGEIEVEAAADATAAVVDLVAHDEESQQLVDAARVEITEAGGRRVLVVDVPQKRGGGFNFGFLFGRHGISCRIRTPERSSLQVRSKSADVTARGLLDAADVATASGDVELADLDGALNVKTASGDVAVHRVAGDASVQSASGDVRVDVAAGAVSIATASGDVEIGDADRDVSANTVSGDQRLSAVVRGSISAHSVSGDVHIGVRRGSTVFLDCNTVSGDTSSELEVTSDVPDGDGPLVEIRARAVSGDIVIARAPAPGGNNTDQEVHA